jgi:bacteriocin biosynthesis cyclodehydratase domain-containing protein
MWGAPEGLPERPCLKPWYRLAKRDGRLILGYASSAVVLEGKAVEKLMPALLPMLDGSRTTAEINERIGEAAAPAVHHALQTLADRGVLTDGPAANDSADPVAETARFLAAVSADELTVAEGATALDDAVMTVIGGGPTALEIGRQLKASGVSRLTFLDWSATAEELSSVDLALVAPEPFELPELERWNRLALRQRQPWLQALPFDGRIAAVGPLYVPDDTCCYQCYQRRRAANLTFGEDDFWALEEVAASYPSSPPLRQIVAGLAATLALRWLGERAAGRTASSVPASLHAVEWREGLEVRRHFVYRVPRCPACFADRGVPSPWHS